MKTSNVIFLIIIIVFLVYASLYIYRTSFIIDGQRYYSLMDDAMIQMRYAKNLANGYGLVWNPGGDRVDGYTNPLWVLYMTLFHLLPISASKICLYIQISAAIILVLNLVMVRNVALKISENSHAVALSSVALTALYFPLNKWSLQGMEVSVLVLVISFSAWLAFHSIKSGKFSFWLYFILGFSTLDRIDMVVPYLAFFFFFLLVDPKNRKQHLIIGLVPLIFFLSIQTIFRYWYTGDILPNTYYVKMTGYPIFLRITRGLWVYIFRFVWNMNWVLFLFPFVMLLFQRTKFLVLLCGVFSAQSLYSIYVGGDAWEGHGGSNRFVSIVMPLYFILFSWGLFHVFRNILTQSLKPVARYIPYFLAFILVISVINFNAVNGFKSFLDWTLINPPPQIMGFKKEIKKALVIDDITKDQATIAVVKAGIVPYFSNRYSIDLLGKNDKKIALENMRVKSGIHKYTAFYPGHLKWDYGYSIGQLKPDIVVELWECPQEAKPYLEKDYEEVLVQGFHLYLYKASTNILWDKLGTEKETGLQKEFQ